MVVSGIMLLIGTSEKIIQQDKISFSTTYKSKESESVISWRNTDFVIEFAFDDGFEVERPIKPDELPYHLKQKYDSLRPLYDHIHLEKVFTFQEEPAYEFYCYRNGELTKFEI